MPKTLRLVVASALVCVFVDAGVQPSVASVDGQHVQVHAAHVVVHPKHSKPAQAKKSRPAYEREYLAHYAELVRRHGVHAAGCNLVTDKYKNRCKGNTTKMGVVKSNVTLERMLFVTPAPSQRSAPTGSTASVAPSSAPSSGGCGDLPSYIVQRESGGDPNAVNPTAPGSASYIGCAQVDSRHFGEWGDCVGLSYVACVNKLWDNGRGVSNWPTAANPPG
jgi:hypothetical protein